MHLNLVQKVDPIHNLKFNAVLKADNDLPISPVVSLFPHKGEPILQADILCLFIFYVTF